MDVKTATRTLDLFEVFADIRRPASLSELAEALKMPLSSCFALVRTVENRGYLYSLRARGPLYPTGRMIQNVRIISEHDPIAQRAADSLGKLRDECLETVVIGALKGTQIVYINIFESPHAIRYMPKAGETRPLYANSIGKAILGAMTPGARAAVLEKVALTKLTDRTLVTRKAVEADILIGSKRGWHCNLRESVADLVALAVAVRINGDLFGVSIAGPAHRMEATNFEKLSRMLRSAAAQIGDLAAPPAVIDAAKSRRSRGRRT